MSHRQRSSSLFWLALTKGLAFGKQSFLYILPLSISMSALEFLLRPRAQPTFVDTTDWLFVFLFFLGLLGLSAFHAAILLQMNALRKRRSIPLKLAMTEGIEKGVWVFSVSALYFLIIFFGFLCFVVPGIYLAVSLYFSLFLVVIHDYKKGIPWYRKLKNYFLESFHLVWGHWWVTLGLLLLIFLVLAVIEQICLFLLERQLILGVIFSVLARAFILPFWYGCILTLLFELKKHH